VFTQRTTVTEVSYGAAMLEQIVSQKQVLTDLQAPSTTTATHYETINSVYTERTTVTEVSSAAATWERNISQEQVLTNLQAPSTYTEVRTQTLSIPFTEVSFCRIYHASNDKNLTCLYRFPRVSKRPLLSRGIRLCQAQRRSFTQRSSLLTPAPWYQCSLAARYTRH
jgi:hypothetical protein